MSSRSTAARWRWAPYFVTLTALSWDNADWNWKHNHDAGQLYEQLFAGDLSKAVRNGGKHRFTPTPGSRAMPYAASWRKAGNWKENPLRVEVKLRKGIMFPEKPGVMTSRELVADDVVFSYTRIANSPKKIPTYFDHIEKVHATDKHTVVFQFKQFNAEWDYRFGWGYFSAHHAEGGRRRRRRPTGRTPTAPAPSC